MYWELGSDLFKEFKNCHFYFLCIYGVFQISINLISKCVITVCKIILYLILINKFQYIEKLSSIFSLFNIIRILSLSFKILKYYL